MKSNQPPIPAHQLRLLAEKADGRRGIDQSIVRVGKGAKAQYDVLTAAEIDARRAKGETIEPLIAIAASHQNAARAKRERETVVTIKVPGAKRRTYNASEVDALFLTEAAVEKFVLPYYARTLQRSEYDTLIKRYYSEEQIAFALVHYPTSMYDLIEGDG